MRKHGKIRNIAVVASAFFLLSCQPLKAYLAAKWQKMHQEPSKTLVVTSKRHAKLVKKTTNTKLVRRSVAVAPKKVQKPASLASNSYDVSKTGHVTEEQLESHFASRGNSVLKGKGRKFLEMEEKYGVSALFMAGIATQESGGGTSARARRNLDSFGMTGRGRHKKWSSVDQNIEDAFSLVSGKLYVKSGRKTPDRIGSRYCASGGWAKKVSHHMKTIVSR